MLLVILRAILYFLFGVLVLRLLRGLGMGRRAVPPAAPPAAPPAPRVPDIDPKDIIDTTCRPVDPHEEPPR